MTDKFILVENIVESQGYVTNYDICFICQEENNNRLICPANSKRSDKNVGYRSLASPLKAFERKGTLPTDIKNRITNTDEGTLFAIMRNIIKFVGIVTTNRKRIDLRERMIMMMALISPSQTHPERGQHITQHFFCQVVSFVIK